MGMKTVRQSQNHPSNEPGRGLIDGPGGPPRIAEHRYSRRSPTTRAVPSDGTWT